MGTAAHSRLETEVLVPLTETAKFDGDRAMQVIDHARHILAGKGAHLAALDDLLFSEEVTALIHGWLTARVNAQLASRDHTPVDTRIAANAAARGQGDSLDGRAS